MNRLKLANAIGEAILPILGLLFFDWGIYFILLYYFIDLVVTEVFMYIKVNKIVQNQKINFPFSTRYGRLIVNSAIMFLVIIISHFAVYHIVPGIDFPYQIIEFLSYEEAGLPIPQGYILLPLVLLGNYQQYNTMFIKTGLYQRQSWKNLIFSRRKALYIATGGSLLAIILSILIPIPGFVYVLGIVGVKFWIDLKISYE
ncbi:hypothetical protein [Brumimicrobium mesophilum]|uniref:hypothetical protein n=1 Tax=Brumimicrobium mesophilum TaxID=392717 RepID=UPI000D144BA2|nr:hypothetical protein [Brumimicrobium mesophilum]